MEDLSEGDVGDGIYPAMAANHHQSEGDWNPPGLGVNSKVPPLFGGRSSWFQHKELVDDWIDQTTLDEKGTAQH